MGPYFQQNMMPKNLTRNFNAKKFFSVSKIVGEALYRGNESTNPTEQAYFHIVACSSGGNDPSSITLNVVIDYLAVLTEPRAIGFS